MKKTLISIIFIAIIFFVGVGSFIIPQGDVIAYESRPTARFPTFSGHISSRKVVQYFNGIDRFLNDHIPERGILLAGYQKLMVMLGDQVNPDRAFEGKDNWLFLGNHYDKNIDKFERKIQPDLNDSENYKMVIELVDAFKAEAANVTFLLGPRKESVYPEVLPPIVKPAHVRYVQPFLDGMRAHGINVVEPTQTLMSSKDKGTLYWKTDTHWNFLGASVAFEQLKQSLSINNCPAYSLKKAENYYGDLTYIGMFPKPPYDLNDNFSIVWQQPSDIKASIIENAKLPKIDQNEILDNPNAPNKEPIWIIGDSFRAAIVPFVSHCFNQTHVFHITYNDKDKLISEYRKAAVKPKYIVIIMTERSL